MYYIITEEKTFPKSLVVKYPNHKIYRSVEFIKVGQEEGFNDDETGKISVLVDIKYLKKEFFDVLQELLSDYSAYGLEITYYSINKVTPPYFFPNDIEIEHFSDKYITAISIKESDSVATIRFNDHTEVVIDIAEYYKYGDNIYNLDYYDIVQELAYEVHEGNKFGF